MGTRFNLKKLQTRTLSALVLAPVTMAVIYFGGLPFLAFILAFGFVALYEWVRMALKTQRVAVYIPFGILYILLAGISFFGIREFGWEYLLLFVLVIWASDIGAYFVGKVVGGPKMAASVSPNKTWAGLMGAVLCPALVGVVGYFVFTLPVTSFGLAFLQAGLTGLAGQGGDLLISYIKREAGVKDSGTIIPGHGGVLDRIDALILGAIVFLGFGMLFYG